MLLAQTIAVSFAMNLFFLAVLLTPVSQPLHSRAHQLPAAIYIAILLACYVGALLLPFSASTPSFMLILLVPHLVLFFPIYLDRNAPRIWRRVSGLSSH